MNKNHGNKRLEEYYDQTVDRVSDVQDSEDYVFHNDYSVIEVTQRNESSCDCKSVCCCLLILAALGGGGGAALCG